MSQQGVEREYHSPFLGANPHHQMMQRLTYLAQWYNEVLGKMNNLRAKPTLVMFNELCSELPRFRKNVLALRKMPHYSEEVQQTFGQFIADCERKLNELRPTIFADIDAEAQQQQPSYCILVLNEEQNISAQQIIEDFKGFAHNLHYSTQQNGNCLMIFKERETLTVTPHDNGVILQGSNSLGIEMLQQWCEKNGWEKTDLTIRILVPDHITPDSPEGVAALATFTEYTRKGFYVTDFQLDRFKSAGLTKTEFNQLKMSHQRLQDEAESVAGLHCQ